MDYIWRKNIKERTECARSLSDLVDRQERKFFPGRIFDYVRRIAALLNDHNRENEQKWLFRSRFIRSQTGLLGLGRERDSKDFRPKGIGSFI